MKFWKFMKKHVITATLLITILASTVVGVVKVSADITALDFNTPTSIELDSGQTTTIQLAYSATSAIYASDFTWTNSSGGVTTAINSSDGVSCTVTALQAGTDTITVECSSYPFTGNVIVLVPLRISDHSNTLDGLVETNTTGAITVNSPNVNWTSSNNEIVEITQVNTSSNSSTAQVKTNKGGNAKITATNSDGQTVSLSISVSASIVKTAEAGCIVEDGVDPYISVEQGKNQDVITTAANNNALYWKSGNELVATVENGTLTGVYAGETYIYVSSIDYSGTDSWEGLTGVDSIRVVVPFQVTPPALTTVQVGDQITFSCTANPSELSYSSSDVSAVTFDVNTGLFTAVGVGESDITIARRNTASSYTAHITVLDGITLDQTKVYVNQGEQTTLTLTTTKDTSVAPITWTISDSSIASIQPSDDGTSVVITGIQYSADPVTLVATQTINGVIKTASCRVYVQNPVQSLTLIYNGMPVTDTISIQQGSLPYITAYLNLGEQAPSNTKLSWKSSDESIITLTPQSAEGQSQLCQITAVGGGTATITVISDDGLYIATATVYVTEGVTGISLGDDDKKTITVQLQLTNYQLAATITPDSDGVDKSVVWTSYNTDIATVNSNGMVTFLKPGTATILARAKADLSVETYCIFEVTQQVEDVELVVKSATINVGDDYLLQAQLYPLSPAPTNQNLIWGSSNPAVCTVDSSGLVHAVSSGSATVVVQTEDGGYIDMANITVLQPVLGIELTATEMSVKKGSTFYLGATCLPDTADDKSVTWASSDTSMAVVDQTGKVSAVGVGSVTISCVSNESGAVAYCLVEITEPVTGLELNSYYEELVKDTKFVIIPTVSPVDAPDKSVTYLSSDPDVASVDENGIVTALKGGTAHILVTTNESSLTQSCTIVVQEFVESVTITGAEELLNVGEDMALGVTVLTETASNKDVIWSSSDTRYATVDQYGHVTGVAEGKVVITAVAADGSGVSDSVVIRVINPVTKIELSDSKITIYVGDTYNVTAKVFPDNASIQDLEWTSNDPTICLAYQDGDIVGVSPGRTTVTVKSTDGNDITATCTVIVKNITYATSISINSSEITMLKGKTRQLTARLYPTKTEESIHWISTDTSIVQVDSQGNIVTVGAGEAEIIAYSTYGTVQDSCVIHSIAMSCTSLGLEQYDTFNLYVDGAPGTVSWRSSNPRIASVDSSGLVIGRMPGECTITGTVDGKTVTCNVKIYAVDPGKFINVLNPTKTTGSFSD